jgi:hypothetical protein
MTSQGATEHDRPIVIHRITPHPAVTDDEPAPEGDKPEDVNADR